MLKVSDELKRIYRMNMLPKGTKADIQGRIVFGDLGLYIGNDRIVKDTFRLTEMISDGGDLDFGSTNASVVEFTVADVPEDLKGQRFAITQTVNGTYTVPLGTFTVDSCKRQDDLRFKDIVAYDDMQKFNRNVAEWYNGLTFPITVKAMRESLCQYCGVAYELVTLVNDGVRVSKTLDTKELNGKEVLRAIAEVNGTFAHINRYAKLTFIGLDSFALYPSETLYPADDLYPIDVTEIVEKQGENAIAYISSKYEDYTVSDIDGVIVRDDENADGGVTVGEATNPYVMSENMLIVGKETAELTTIANNLLGKIGQVVYTPHDTESIGLPYVEVGDTVLNANSADKELFIAKRVLTGVSSVMDNFSANGNPKRENNDTVDSVEIRKLKGKTMKIFKDIDRIGVEIGNFETQTTTNFTVMDGRIVAEIERAGEAEASLQMSINGVSSRVTNLGDYTESQLTQLSGSINSKVSKGNIISEINQSAEQVKIKAEKILLEGYTTINGGFSIDEQGNASLNTFRDNEIFATASLSGSVFSLKANIGSQYESFQSISPIGYVYREPNGSANWQIIGHPYGMTPFVGGDDPSSPWLRGYFSELKVGGSYVATRDELPTQTNQITASTTEYGNIDFGGSVNGASVTYVQENFARLSALEELEKRVAALEG